MFESEAEGLNHGDEVAAMIGVVRSLCERGGKRIRPTLCFVGGLCVDAEAEATAFVEAGTALELLQAYFLIHDDWMDQDAQRRGGPTAHISLSKHFHSKQLGERSAILAGDHAVALAQRILAGVPVSPARLRHGFKTFATMQLDAVAGQQLDIVSRAEPELTYELKTASYTVLGPLRLGAELAGGSKRAIQCLEAFAKPAGIAFQLKDDLIGVFGDPDQTGKPRGADLSAGKNTPLIRSGRRLLAGKERMLLEKVLTGQQVSGKRLQALVVALDSCGARAEVAARIEELKQRAELAIEGTQLSQRGVSLLSAALVALTERAA